MELNLIPCPTRRSARHSRRQALRALSAGTAGLGLPQILTGAAANRAEGPAKHCIYLFLCGGPSQLDMWDPKPEAPSGIRSVFRPISTYVPGIQLTELLPETAKHADKFSIVRSMHHDNPNHDVGILYTLLATSNPPNKRAFPPSRSDRPGLGGALANLLGAPGELPAWVTLPRHFTTGSRFYKGQTAGFLGAEFDSFTPNEPKVDSLGDKEFEVSSLGPVEGLDLERIRTRQHLLGQLERLETLAADLPETLPAERYREKAFEMLTTNRARDAFDLRRESESLRDRYGRNEYGQSFLMARRLVESGVRTINVFWTFYGKDGCQFNLWDNHGSDKEVCGGYNRGIDMITAPYCCPAFDKAYSALLEDLHQRGLLDETLVVVVGEFGRTPKINSRAGRDHWPNCYSAVLAGGGIRGGEIYGKSDSHAAYVEEKGVTPDDFGATILHAFGIRPETPIYDQQKRPIPVSRGNPVKALFG